jgi:hypothetical protein
MNFSVMVPYSGPAVCLIFFEVSEAEQGMQTFIMEGECSLKALFSNYQAATLSYHTRTQYEGNNNLHPVSACIRVLRL